MFKSNLQEGARGNDRDLGMVLSEESEPLNRFRALLYLIEKEECSRRERGEIVPGGQRGQHPTETPPYIAAVS